MDAGSVMVHSTALVGVLTLELVQSVVAAAIGAIETNVVFAGNSS